MCHWCTDLDLIFEMTNKNVYYTFNLHLRPETSKLITFGRNWPSVWVKMASSWVCIIVYAITLFVPTCWPSRDLSDIPIGSLPRKKKSEPGNRQDPETYV